MSSPDFDSVSGPLAKSASRDPAVSLSGRYVASHEPSAAQFAAGNYKKRKLDWRGLTIAIENEAGSVRRGTKPDGTAWETRMLYPYGYVLGSLGVDGDHVDVFVGPRLDAPLVYVIHQRKVDRWDEYDEDKCMVGFESQEDAVHAFLANYDDPRFLGPVTALPADEFARKVLEADGRMVKALDFGDAMLKADHGPITAGAHWITVHSHGDGKGQPLLVMPQNDGSMKVIGGAGGALNHLTLRGVGKGEDYKESVRKRQAELREKRQAQIQADKESGIYEAKQQLLSGRKEQLRQARRDAVNEVGKALGWNDLEFDEAKHADLSEDALKKARKDHETMLFKRAREALASSRQLLLNDHEARADAGLGAVPLQASDADSISVADLDPMPERTAGLGFAANYGERAEAHGLTEDNFQLAAQEALGDAAPVATPEAAEAKAAKQEAKAGIAKELEEFKLSNPDAVQPNAKVVEDANKAAAIVRAMKKFQLLQQQAKKENAKLADAASVEGKGHILEVSDAEVEAAAREQVEQDIRTIGAAGLLSEIGKMGGEESLGGHVSAGAFNALNAFSGAIAGESIMDRSVVDVLGVNAAAQILARRLASSHEAAEYKRVLQGVEKYHLHSQVDIQDGAVAHARACTEAAEAIELPEGATGDDLALAQELNQKRRDAIAEGKKVLGQATGELQAGAALVMSLREGARDHIEVSLGKVQAKAALIQLHAIGLEQGDYKLEEAGGNLIATITGAGMDKLASPVDVEGMRQIKRNLDIISGKQDEEGWLPKGFASRPDLAMHVEPGVAPKLAQPFNPDHAGGLTGALQDYIGGRVADGDALTDILADVQSADFFKKAGDADGYRKALDAVVPLKQDDGKMRPIESLRDAFEAYADGFVSDHYGTKASPLHRQSFDVGAESVDALHRALSSTPEGVAAFKAIGDLSRQDRAGLREFWKKNVARNDAGAEDLAAKIEAHEKDEPAKEVTDMFGEATTSPEWQAWKDKGDGMRAELSGKSLDWNKYVKVMGSQEAALSAVQDMVRSRVSKDFADSLASISPSSALKLGRAPIRGALNHLDAVDPAAREKRMAEQRAVVDGLRERIDGKYAGGTVADKIAAEKEKQQAFEQAQMGFFSTDELPPDASSQALGADERYTLGHAAEQKLAGMMSVVGPNFKPGKPTKLWSASMSGKYAPQQRAIKLMEANKRIMLGYGAGSGKTGICLGATSHLIETGKIKRAIHLVPSIVQDQYDGEALRYLEPGKYKWHCKPGASQAERIAAYKDPSNHFCVMTHESFRADMLHMGAQHLGISDDEMTEKVARMQPDERAAWAKSVMEKEGIDFGAVFVDEAHQIVNRKGKDNSARANVIDAVSDNAPYYAYSSGDPAKNDASEIHDILSKMDRKRYADRDAFLRKYGVDTIAAKAGLKRELARYGISNLIAPDIKADYQNVTVPLSDHQKAGLRDLDKAAAKMRIARATGKVDVESAKLLSPGAFAGVPEADHEKVAARLQKSLGMVKESAVNRLLNSSASGNAKIDKLLEIAGKHAGQPGVVFAHNKASVDQIVAALKAKGLRVATITGADSAVDKAKKKGLFMPESGDPQADIMVMSDAGAVGMNLQRGQWLVHHDIPPTAMVHGQRSARIHRLGQHNDVSVYTLAADHKSERRALDRLQKKYQLRELMLDPMDSLDDTGMAQFIRMEQMDGDAANDALHSAAA